jgi:Tfp pilus assembly protein PilV
MVVGAAREHTVCAMRPATRTRRSHNELGFSLLELLVAILLVDVAILAIVHTHAITVRSRNETHARGAAVNAAAARIEQILALPCVATTGSALQRASAEFWSSRLDATTREISDSIEFGAPTRHRFVLRTRSQC